MPHTRTDIDLDNEVLRALSGAHYKVLRYLCNRADSRGVCFPTNETIAQGVGYDERHTARLLPDLVDMGLVAYLRRDEYDWATGRKMPNVYIVNPKYISLAEANQAEAESLWKAACPYDSGVTLTNNKNQHQSTNTIKPTPKTNNNNQQPNAPAKAKERRAPEKLEDPTAARENDETQDAPPDNSAQRTAKHTNPGVPPRRPAQPFVNPAPIAEKFEDGQHETLALRLRGLGIPMPMARGFVNEYGVRLVEDAMLQTLAADKGIDDGVRNHAGFFRAVLQSGLADRYTFKAHEDDQEVGY